MTLTEILKRPDDHEVSMLVLALAVGQSATALEQTLRRAGYEPVDGRILVRDLRDAVEHFAF